MARKKQKTGPKPKPLSELARRGVLVKFTDRDYEVLKSKAQRQPLATYLRERGLAS